MGALSLGDAGTVSFWFGVTGEILLWISVVLTLISGVVYVCQNFDFIRNAK